MTIWISSDLHFNHNKPFLYEKRGYNSIKEHDENIIHNWNLIVEKDDDVYILGDLMMGEDKEYGKKCIENLNGKLHLIFGNHDSKQKQKMYAECKNVVEILGYAAPLKYKKYHFFLTHYPTICANYDEDNEPLRKKIINICGHTHTKNRFIDLSKGLIYHCELDAHHNFPVKLDQIIEELKSDL